MSSQLGGCHTLFCKGPSLLSPPVESFNLLGEGGEASDEGNLPTDKCSIPEPKEGTLREDPWGGCRGLGTGQRGGLPRGRTTTVSRIQRGPCCQRRDSRRKAGHGGRMTRSRKRRGTAKAEEETGPALQKGKGQRLLPVLFMVLAWMCPQPKPAWPPFTALSPNTGGDRHRTTDRGPRFHLHWTEPGGDPQLLGNEGIETVHSHRRKDGPSS